MTYINRKIVLMLFLLNSCAYLEYRDIFEYSKNYILGIDDLIIDADYLKDRQSSFIKVKLGRSKVATFTLSSYSDLGFIWVGANNEQIITKHGRVIETSQLDHNLEILTKEEVTKSANGSSELLIALFNPSAIISQSINRFDLGKKSLLLDKTYLTNKYKEAFNTDSYSWSGTNYYWLDVQTNLPLKTISSPHPLLDEMEIEFYYKYK